MKTEGHRGRLVVAVQVASFVVAGGLFTYQLSQLVAHYLSHPTTIAVTLRLPPSLLPPPIVVCPEHPFHLEVLRDLGMNIDNLLVSNVSSLQNLDPDEDALRVWENVSYELGQVVNSFSFGNLQENYTRDTLSSPYWRRVTTPLGSCFVLHLPPVTDPDQELPSLIITLRKMQLRSSCPLNPYSCSPEQVAQRCNSSCAFERLLVEDKLGSYFILIGKLYNSSSHHHNDRLEPSTGYLLAEDAWHTAYLGTSYDPLNVIEIYSTLVERWPLKCDLTAKVSAIDFDTCVDNYFLTKHNCVPVRPNSEITLKKACKIGLLHEAILRQLPGKAVCSGPLADQCHHIEWEHEVKNGLDMESFITENSQVRLNFTSPRVRVETEVDMYPLSQLASDIGGSLGMFLGMSVLTVWQCVGVHSHHFLPQRSWGRHFNRRHCRQLMYWIVIVSLAFLTAVHSLLALQIYVNQPVRVSVKRSDTTEDLHHPDNHNHLFDQVAALLASRALDCRAGPHTADEECMLNCLMQQTMRQISSVSPFVEVDDLPVCPEKHNWTYSVTYIVPSLSYATATNTHLTIYCRQKCGEVIMRAPRGLKVNHQYYLMTINDLLCSLGGIISLYAGLFLTSTIKLVIQLVPSNTPSTRRLRNVVRVALGSIIYVIGSVMAVFLLHRFIFDHPISSGKQMTNLTPATQPVVTVCFWPPFQPSVEENFSLSVDEAWAASAWSQRVSRAAITRGLGRLTRDEKDYNLTSVTTMFNNCDSVAARVLYKNLMASFYYWWNPNASVVVGVHGPQDPPFVSHIDKVGELQALTLYVVTARYQRVSQPSTGPDTPTYDTCLYRCVHDMYSDRLKCRLPFITWRPDLPPCSQEAARRHPLWPQGDAPPKRSLTRRGDSSHCHAACRQYKTEMLLVWGERERWLESGVNLLQLPESFVDLQEEDWYTPMKLMNDLGVVAGFTFGASVFSILQDVLLSGLSRF